MKQHRQIILTGILLTVVILGVAVINLRMVFTLVDTQDDYERVLDAMNRASLANREAQINFKTQVQEWKNVLIRGFDAEDFAQYFKQFEFREAEVRRRLLEVARFTSSAIPELKETIDRLLNTHRELGTAYREALREFEPDDPTSYQVVDRQVRGIDRGPQVQMEGLSHELDRRATRLVSAARQRVSNAKTEAIWVSVVVVLAGILVTGILLHQIYTSSRRLETARRQAIEANRAKSLFLANMSHEIRTPLNGVIGMLEILESTKLNADQKEQLGIIRGSGETLLAILNDILDFSKIEAGKVDLEPAPTDIRKLAEGVVALFRARATNKHLEISCVVDGDLPPTLRVDELRLRQILINLVQNAVKFTEAGFVKVHITWDPSAENSQEGDLVIEVCDSGVGIPGEKAARLFESFYQAESDPDRRYGGSGLGLTICRRLLELMDGRIEVESEVGTGSTFRFSVPTTHGGPEATGEQAGPNPENSGAVAGATGAPPAQKIDIDPELRILLAEDNLTNQKVALHMLERAGLRADLASDGEEAVRAYQKNHYDLILMDIQMPRLSGTDATKRIRELSGSDSEPWIIALTAGALHENKAEAFAAGLNDYLSKPFNSHVFMEKLSMGQKKQRGKGL